MESPPRFVFICGAVGSGNTLMFDCLTRDPHTYGINEDALGATLERFCQSEKDFGRCPHAIDTFLDFLAALRNDRRTLVLKTPSNLRRRSLIRKHIPDVSFVMMVREPHAAIVSGLARHHEATVEETARIWLRDYEQYAQPDEWSIVVTFESLVCQPRETLDALRKKLMPLDDKVLAYAEQIASPQRASSAWWQSKVDAETVDRISQAVGELRLGEKYRHLSDQSIVPPNESLQPAPTRIGPVRRATDKLREWTVKSLHRGK